MSWLKELKRKLPENFKGDYKFNEPLSKHNKFRIGGRCLVWCEPKDLEDLKFILKYTKEENIPLFVIGEGSNILVRDKGFKGIVIHLDTPYFRRIEFRGNFVFAGCGLKLSQIIRLAAKKNLGGLEFLFGIPGSLGGALVMNAGSSEKSIGDLIEDITVMDYNGRIKILNKRNIRFGYRNSNLSRFIILSAHLRLVKRDRKEIEDRIARYRIYRKRTQPQNIPSAGCIFKNPKGLSAGKIIEECGLKGKRIGGAEISYKHANFILNKGKAKARDILRLMRFIQKKVYKKYRILLEPEIKII